MKKNLVIDAKEAVLLQTSLLSYKNVLKKESDSDKPAVSFEAPEETIKSIDQALRKLAKTFSCDGKGKPSLQIERNGMMLSLDTVIGAFNLYCRKYRDCELDVISLIGYSFKHDEIYEIVSGSNILSPQITTAFRLKTLLQTFCQALGNGNDPLNNDRFTDCIAQICKHKGMARLNKMLSTAAEERENTEIRIIRMIEDKYSSIGSTFSIPNGMVFSFPRDKWGHLKEAFEDIDQMIKSGKLIKQSDSDQKCYRTILEKINETLKTADNTHCLLNIRLDEKETCVFYDTVRMLRNLYFSFLNEFNNQTEHRVLACRYFKLSEYIDEQLSDKEIIDDEYKLLQGGKLSLSDYDLELAVKGLDKLTEDASFADKTPESIRVYKDSKEYSRLRNLLVDAENTDGKNSFYLSREDIILFIDGLRLLKAEKSKLYRDLSDNVMEQILKNDPADFDLQAELLANEDKQCQFSADC